LKTAATTALRCYLKPLLCSLPKKKKLLRCELNRFAANKPLLCSLQKKKTLRCGPKRCAAN
jgi:hypothetical protein